MDKTKHTPGPWHVGMKPGPIIYSADGSQVADLTADLINRGERAENARLIAAAPETLEALETLLGMAATFPTELHENHPDVVAARAAIAKARGE